MLRFAQHVRRERLLPRRRHVTGDAASQVRRCRLLRFALRGIQSHRYGSGREQARAAFEHAPPRDPALVLPRHVYGSRFTP
jgi:hypothetical protein